MELSPDDVKDAAAKFLKWPTVYGPNNARA
jgi:hypothetical protein